VRLVYVAFVVFIATIAFRMGHMIPVCGVLVYAAYVLFGGSWLIV